MDSVEIHEVFLDQFDPNDPAEVLIRDGLVAAFHYWAKYGDHPDFGKDYSYRDPQGSVVPKVGLRHVHLRPSVMTPDKAKTWDDPDCEPHRKTSNRHLVYVRSDENDRLLIYYFEADAHIKAREDDYKFLKALGRAAQEWLSKNSFYPDVSDS